MLFGTLHPCAILHGKAAGIHLNILETSEVYFYALTFCLAQRKYCHTLMLSERIISGIVNLKLKSGSTSAKIRDKDVKMYFDCKSRQIKIQFTGSKYIKDNLNSKNR